MCPINYKGFLYLFIVFGFVGLTLANDSVPHENKVCARIKDAAQYCFEVKPLINAQKRVKELNKPFFNNETISVTQTAILRKKYKIIEFAEYVKQNKNFAEQNKELKRNIAELVQILQQSGSKIDCSFKLQEREFNAKIERLTRQNEILNAELNALKQDNQKEEIIQLKLENDNQKKEIIQLKYEKNNQEEEIIQLRKDTETRDKIINNLECERDPSYCQNENEPIEKFVGCSNLPTGLHNIKIENCGKALNLRCNNDIANGGWIVILHRFNGSENFYRNWSEFRTGFGNPKGEFFIGLENLYCITNSNRFELYIKYKYFSAAIGIAQYDNFIVGDEQSLYRLESLGQFRGTSDNQMTLNNLGQKFSTYDRDNDVRTDRHCAKDYLGAWWFKTCAGPNPLGRYSKNKSVSELSSMSWDGTHPIESIQMLIRPYQ